MIPPGGTLSPLDTAAVPKETAADTPLAFSQKRRSWPPRPGVVVSCGEMNSPSDFFKFFPSAAETLRGCERKMNFAAIKRRDVANGPGVRVSLFVSGCRHRCPGCFNPEAWDFGYGQPFTRETEDAVLAALAPDYVKGLSLLGGEPFDPDNQPALAPFLGRVREAYPDKTVWCYTGYLLAPDLRPGGRAWTGHTDAMLRAIDVLVDGPFVLAEKDLSLRFRGSRNQRILRVADSLAADGPVLWTGE